MELKICESVAELLFFDSQAKTDTYLKAYFTQKMSL